MEQVFFELTIILCLAAGLAFLFRYLKQPAILAYILAGMIVGPIGLFHLESREVTESFAQIGVTLLLFMLGLELRLKELQSVGKIAILTGIGQIVFTSFFGFIICSLLGFSVIVSIYISIALTFSSTIIIIKLLSDKKDLKSLYGKIAVGFLLVQDFVAIIALIFLSGFTVTPGSEGVSPIQFVFIILKALFLFAGVIFLSRTILPKLVDTIAKSSELLFLFSIAWAFGVAALVSSSLIGFSIEIGGFLAGLALANSSENYQIIAKVKALRDFFITLFFVLLGMKMVFSHVAVILVPALLLSAFVLIGNPIIVMILLGFMGYRRRTSFLAGLTVAQISEFSLIVMFMGNKIGHVTDEAVALVTIVGAITFIVSAYMILHGNRLYTFFFPFLGIFERNHPKETTIDLGEIKGHILLIGANRMGESILDALLQNKDDVVVVDFDPDVVTRLTEKGVRCLYGDIVDPDIQEHAGLGKAKMVISTVPDVEDNTLLLEGLRHTNKKATSVVFAVETEDAKKLYKAGADYVVLPHLAGGRHLAKILIDNNHLELIEKYKTKDLSYLT